MTASTMPQWLQQTLIAKGTMTPSGLFRTARLIGCRHCSMPVLAGLDADLCAFEAAVDPGELTAEGELRALLDERDTYELDLTRRLHRRDRHDIRARPAGGSTAVLAAHRCERMVPAAWCVAPRPTTSRSATASEECPF